MSIQKWGGVAAITEAMTYLFGFILFFGVLGASGNDSPAGSLAFLIQHRDTFFLGYLVSGILFSFTLIILVQAVYQRLHRASPQLMTFAAVVGFIWAAMVLASSFIFLTSLGSLAKVHSINPEGALLIHQSMAIVVDALGGGIELVGAVWVLTISYVGLRSKIYPALVHYWGYFVAVAGVLTLFSGLSFLSTHPIFEVATAIFGLGQIVWFVLLGIAMLRAPVISMTNTRESK
jgi:hypothetical protein